ncbi:MAG TPA: hypothetical protein VMR43_01960, partial [Variovorax sp.]|nr:hypothetical protein [Variovorax sp.]
MNRRLVGIATGLLVAGLTVPLGACADTTGRSAVAGRAKAPARLETAQRKANGSGIEVRYQVQAATAPGQTVRVTLVLDDVTDPAGATVRLAADSGLVLLQDGAPRALPAGRATTLEADVTLLGSATGYLSVFTTQHGVGSVTSIRVPIGNFSP